MEKQKYLNQAFYLDKLIKSYKEELMEYKATFDDMEILRSINRTLQTDPENEAVYKKCCNAIYKKSRRYGETISRLIEIRAKIGNSIESISNMQWRTIMRYRYLNCKAWEDIAAEMGMTRDNCMRINRKAIEEMKITEDDFELCQESPLDLVTIPVAQI